MATGQQTIGREPDGRYGWWIVLLATMLMAMTAPGQTVAFSVFVDPMIAGLELTRSQLSAAYLIGTLAGAAFLPRVGRAIDRLGVRRMSATVGLLFATALLAMSGVVGFVTLAIGLTGIRLLGQGALSLTSTTAVTLWFDRRRGMALGITTAGGAAGISLAPLVIAVLIARFDWRVAWSITGLAVLCIVLPAAAMLQDRPDRRPRVSGQLTEVDRAAQRAVGSAWSRSEAARTLMFWTIAAAVASTAMITTGIAFHQISLLGERGLDVTEAAANFLPQTAAAIVVTLAMGTLVDRFAPRPLIMAAMAWLAAAMVLAQVAEPGMMAVAFGIAAGASAGAMRALEAAAIPRYFGIEHVGAIRGTLMALKVAASAYGPTVLAFGFDRTGSYASVLNGLLVLPVGVALLAVAARVPDERMLGRIRGAT